MRKANIVILFIGRRMRETDIVKLFIGVCVCIICVKGILCFVEEHYDFVSDVYDFMRNIVFAIIAAVIMISPAALLGVAVIELVFKYLL